LVEDRGHIERFNAGIKSNRISLRPACGVVSCYVPPMGPPLPLDGVSGVGDANSASLMKRLPTGSCPARARALPSPAHPCIMHEGLECPGPTGTLIAQVGGRRLPRAKPELWVFTFRHGSPDPA
jgi:hypothetical protein